MQRLAMRALPALLLLSVTAVAVVRAQLLETTASWVRMHATAPSYVNASNTPGAGVFGGPAGRCHASMSLIDPVSGVAWLQGGYSSTGSLSDSWKLQLPANDLGAGQPVWTPVTPTGSTPVHRYGAAVEYLPDFQRVILFGGMQSSPTTPIVYLDDIHLLDTANTQWTTIVPLSADGISNPGPFARAHTQWVKISESAVPNADNDPTYTLVLYGGRGSSVAGVGSAYDMDWADLWMYQFSRNSSALAGSAQEFYGRWTRAEDTVCDTPDLICQDASTLGQRWPDVGAAIAQLETAIAPGYFRPSTRLGLLDTLRTTTDLLGSLTTAQLAAWNPALPHPNDPSCDGGCKKLQAAALLDPSLGLHPGVLEGSSPAAYGDVVVYYGGYNCLAAGSPITGGEPCFSNDVWIYNRTSQGWTIYIRPEVEDKSRFWTDQQKEQAAVWPSGSRAFHAVASAGNRMFIYGGGFRPEFLLVNYYASLWVFDLATLLWQSSITVSDPPNMGWGASMVIFDSNAYLFGGCEDDSWSASVYQLRIDQQIYPDNVWLWGPGVQSNTSTGRDTWFVMQTREYTPPAVEPATPFVAVPGAGQVVSGTWGANLVWGTRLKFTVQLINENRGLTRATVTELGAGAYNVSYTLQRGHLFSLYVMMTANPNAGTNDVIGTPIKLYNMPDAPAPVFLTYVASPTIKGAGASMLVHLRDRMGNLVLSGGDISGAISAQSGQLSNPAATNTIVMQLHEGASYTAGNIPAALQTLSSVVSGALGAPAPPANAISRIVDLGDGSYRLEYVMPEVSTEQFQIFLYFNGVLFGSAAAEQATGASAALSTADATSYPMPLTLSTFPQHELDDRLVHAGYGLTGICIVVVLAYMVVLTIYREERVVKASSYFFLMTLCCGVLLCFTAAFMLAVTNDHTCRAYPLILGFGYILLIGSLFVKSQRIMSIFTTKKLQVMNLSNLRTGFPILILLALELIFAIAWLVSDPLHRIEEPYVSNPYQHYVHCDSKHKSIWVAVTFIEKVCLAVYGIYLATKTRNVPKAYNESQLMAFSLYNIAFTVLICFLLLYITQSNNDVNVPYIAQVLTILWCCMWTCSLLIIPRIYYILNPPGADFYMANKSKAGVSGGGTSSVGNLSRKNTFTERKNTVTERKNTVTERKNTVTDRKETVTRKPTMTNMNAPVRKNTGVETEMGPIRPASSSTAVRPAALSTVARPPSSSIAPMGAGGAARATSPSVVAGGTASNPRNLPPLPRGNSSSTVTRPPAASVARALPSGSPTPNSPSPVAAPSPSPRAIDEHAKLNSGARGRGSSEDFSDTDLAPNPLMLAAASAPPPPPPDHADPPSRVEGQTKSAAAPAPAPPAPSSPFALRAQPHRPSVDLSAADMGAFRPPPPPSDHPASPSVQQRGVAAHPSSMDSSSSESDSETEREEVRKVIARQASVGSAAAPSAAAVAVAASMPPPPPPPGSDDEEEDDDEPAASAVAAPAPAPVRAAPPAPMHHNPPQPHPQPPPPPPPVALPYPFAMPAGGIPPPPPPPGDPDDEDSDED